MMTISSNGTLAEQRNGRAVILARIGPADRLRALVATGRAPQTAELILAGAPHMLASAVELLGWHDAWAVLDTAEFHHAALWRMRAPR